MPTIATEGRFRFVVNTLEAGYEAPHVHVWIAGTPVCRIRLNTGLFMDTPPEGEYRSILNAYEKHATAIKKAWDNIHGR